MPKLYLLGLIGLCLAGICLYGCGTCVEIAEDFLGVEESPQTIEFCNEEVTIPSETNYLQALVIPKEAFLEGRIQVIEGDNVHLYLMDGASYNNFQKGKSANTYINYQSTILQTFAFTSPLSTTYYLIIQNPAIFNSKKVHVKLSLTATESQLKEAGLIE